jgi:UDP-N-acetylglucosamine--dolichyl-phosphate N-acetylglucosaminephosphotransferase
MPSQAKKRANQSEQSTRVSSPAVNLPDTAAIYMKANDGPRSMANFLLALAPYFPILILSPVLLKISPVMSLLPTAVASAGAFALAFGSIPIIKHYTFAARLIGRDINKPHRPVNERVPESLGVVCGVSYLVVVIIYQVYLASRTPAITTANLMEYNAGLSSICFMIFLGFSDDVLNLPWRYKLLLPTLASLPILVAYGGSTTILLPNTLPFMTWLPRSLDLGILYKLYMCLLSVFCTNSINILAGINGLEAGQSLIIGVFVVVHKLLQIQHMPIELIAFNDVLPLVLMFPLLAVTSALLYYNWFPSTVFVGDTFCYFVGMTFAVVGIFGNFSKTLLLFFIPQIVNFLYSLPQLLGVYPCERHRLPLPDHATGLLSGQSKHMNVLNLALRCVSVLLLQGPAFLTHSTESPGQ